MKRTKEFKEKVCSTCRNANKKVKPAGKECKARNARVSMGRCSEYH